jgi:cyclopropane-fatty-acyl-phospholipid synthase
VATRTEIESTYDFMDELFRSSLGEWADITCAWFGGNFSKTLEEAQVFKHNYILSALQLERGRRLLDVGCGWGPMLNAARSAGVIGVGLTLSQKQFQHCTRSGFETHLLDWRDVDPLQFGGFDAISAIGSFEHFCSEREHGMGLQDDIYKAYFDFAAGLLRPGTYMYLQTMVWGSNAPNPSFCDMSAKDHSNESIVAHLREFYPGSFLPSGADQVIRNAKPKFDLVEISNGRTDYIETMTRWRSAVLSNRSLLPLGLKLLPKYVTSRSFRSQIRSMRFGYNKECFIRNIFDHFRFVFRLRDK